MVVTSVRLIASVLLVGLVLGPTLGSAAVVTAPTAATTGSGGHGAALVSLQAAPEADNTITRIVVHENGSATWTLQIRTRLATDESEAEYRTFQDRFRENTSRYLGDFRESITGIVDNARVVTGREMSASGFRASTSIQSIPRRWGIVTFAFRWDGFAATTGDRLVVGDVFEGGLFIAESDSIEVVAPDGYRIASADPTADEAGGDVVTWVGREDFADGRPRVVVEPSGPAGAEFLPSPVLLGGAVVLVLGGLVALGYRRYGGPRGGGTVPWTGAAEESAGDPTSSGDPTSTGGEVLMADEDYVREALAERGGRMRQKAIAEALDWSRSKTSRVLGRMAEDGQVEKLQLGRENVIALPEETDAAEE